MLNGSVFDFEFFSLSDSRSAFNKKAKYSTLFVSVRKKVLTKPSKLILMTTN
jgi:hypothetical protein